ERALVAEFHVVRAGDIGGGCAPGVRTDPVGHPVQLAVILQVRYVAVVRAAGRALLGDVDEGAVVAVALLAAPVRQIRADARFDQPLARRRQGPRQLRHALELTGAAGCRFRGRGRRAGAAVVAALLLVPEQIELVALAGLHGDAGEGCDGRLRLADRRTARVG